MSHRYSLSSALLIVFLLVLASRLPFLGPGYGVDSDGWRAVQSGLHFVQTGEYRYSRQPGYPLQEALGGLVAAQPCWVGNLVTAAMSAVAAVFFLLILRFYGVRDDVLGALALWTGLRSAVTSSNACGDVWRRRTAALCSADRDLRLRPSRVVPEGAKAVG